MSPLRLVAAFAFGALSGPAAAYTSLTIGTLGAGLSALMPLIAGILLSIAVPTLGARQVVVLVYALSGGGAVFTWLSADSSDPGLAFLFGVIAAAGLWFFATIGSLFPRREKRAAVTGKCRVCGYDLSGNLSGICPECGRGTQPRI